MEKSLIIVERKKQNMTPKIVFVFLIMLFSVGMVIGGVFYWISLSMKNDVQNPYVLLDNYGKELGSESYPFTIPVFCGDWFESNLTLKHLGINNDAKSRFIVEIRREDGSLPDFNDTKIILTDMTNGRLLESYDGKIEDVYAVPLNGLLNYTVFWQYRDNIVNGTYTINMTVKPNGDFNFKK